MVAALTLFALDLPYIVELAVYEVRGFIYNNHKWRCEEESRVDPTGHAYTWKRFWCPREGTMHLSEGGYLSDLDSEAGHLYNPDVVPFECLANVPCSVLLGEPGIGKTYTVKSEFDAIRADIEKEGGQVFWSDLSEYGDEDRLVRDLFASEKFVSWVKG